MKKLIVASLFLISFSYVHAQTIGTASIDGIDIRTTPANPAPGDNITVNVVSYTTNLNGASISWIVGGKSFAKGTGVTSITVEAPPIGSKLQVLADIKTVEGADIEKLVTLQSSSVDMIVETSGYTPPLYRGKEPFIYQNTIKIVAMPHIATTQGKLIDPKDLIYTWKQDSTVLGSQSGYDKQSLSITGPLISRPFVVDVQVSSVDGTVQGEGEIGLNAANPSVVFYQDDPLYGVLYNEAVPDNISLIHNQLKIVATPYGFDGTAGNGDTLTYEWMVNDTSHDELASSTSIILAAPSGSSGSSDVSLTIQNNNQILQTATGGFSAVYNDTSTQNSSISF